MDISHDLKHLIVDDWLHIEFHSPNLVERALELGTRLRSTWEVIVDQKLNKLKVNREIDD